MTARTKPRWSGRHRRWLAILVDYGPGSRRREVFAPGEIGERDGPGASAWFAAEEARRIASKPPPDPPATQRRPDSRPCGDDLKGRIILALPALPPVVAITDLAGAMGLAVGEIAPAVALMARGNAIETWPDERRAGLTTIMLSSKSLARLGLALSPRGDRWLKRTSTGKAK